MCAFLCKCCKKSKKPRETIQIQDNQLKLSSNCFQRKSNPSLISNNLGLPSTISNVNTTKNLPTISFISSNNLMNFNPTLFASNMTNNENNRSTKALTKLRYSSQSYMFKKDNQPNKSNSNYIKNENIFINDFKDKVRCFFCGGKKCKYENFLENENYPNAIKGLNSNFITEDIIASQRPSDSLIKKYDLVRQFKDLQIGMIINLQREGEHPYCGPSCDHISPTGYSYNPILFSSAEIRTKLCGWKDVNSSQSMNFMLEIVKEMTYIIQEKKQKVLVHCHAGYGRTGICIACYMLYNSNDSSEIIIERIRTKRKKCVESTKQKSFCKKFQNFISQCRTIFTHDKLPIDIFLKRQEDLLFGEEKKKYGFVPRIITKSFEKIITIKNKYNLPNRSVYNIISKGDYKWSDEYETILISLKNSINKNVWNLFEEVENLIFIKELLFDWLEDCVDYVISPSRTENIINSKVYKECRQENGIVNSNTITHLFNVIKGEFHIYEYEILFQIAAFSALVPPDNGNESKYQFIDMLDRISLSLLGFVYGNNNEIQDPYTKEIVTGLTLIINLIYESLIITLSPIKNISKLEFVNLNGKNIPSFRSIKIMSPTRNQSSIFSHPNNTKYSVSNFQKPKEPNDDFIQEIKNSIKLHKNNTIKEKESDLYSNSLLSDNNLKEFQKDSILKEIYKTKIEEKNSKVSSSEDWNSEKGSNIEEIDIEEKLSPYEKPQMKTSMLLPNVFTKEIEDNKSNQQENMESFSEKTKKFKSGGVRTVKPILMQLMAKNIKKKG